MKRTNFEASSRLPASAADLFAWHERPGAFERLRPPWEHVCLISHEGIRDGQRAVIRMGRFPFARTWIAEHRDYRPGESFQDMQIAGPFAEWEHTHRVTPEGETTARLTDAIEYRLPAGALGQLLAGRAIRRKIERVFRFRHRRTLEDLTFWNQLGGRRTMKVLITGGTGLIGGELASLLTTGGHEAVILTRSQSKSPHHTTWNPDAETYDPRWFEGYDAVVHLAGENIAGRRWTAAYKQRLRDSRIQVTGKLARALARLDAPPRVLVSASAIGWYGARDDIPLDETAEAGEGFLPDLCREWEAAAAPAAEAGIRVVHPRLGVVLSPRGGALAKMLLPFKLGAGGVVGSGRQVMSWIGIDDAVAGLAHAVFTDTLRGPINLTSPQAVTNREFTKTLGRVLRRPTIFPMPAFAARLAFGEMADGLLLSGARVVPGKLLESGYTFRHPELEDCLRHLLGR